MKGEPWEGGARLMSDSVFPPISSSPEGDFTSRQLPRYSLGTGGARSVVNQRSGSKVKGQGYHKHPPRPSGHSAPTLLTD